MKKVLQLTLFLEKHIGLISIFFVFSFMLIISWLKWPDVFIDFGRELYIPWIINNGAILYKDIDYVNAPFSPHLNALLFRIFGTHLLTLVIFNIITIIFLSFIIFKFFSEVSNKLTGIMTTIVFIAVFAFGNYTVSEGNYNFVAPYSHDLTHGVIISITICYLFLQYFKTQKVFTLFLIGFLSGIVLMTKVEVVVAILSAVTIGILIYVNKRSFSKGQCIQFVFVLASGSLLAVFLFYLLLLVNLTFLEITKELLFPYKLLLLDNILNSKYYQICSGLDDPCANLLKMQIVFLTYAAMFVLIWVLGIFFHRLKGRLKNILWVTTVFIGLLVFFLNIYVLPLLDMARAIPMAVFILLVYLGYKIKQDFKNYNILSLFIFCFFAFLLLLKILLFSRFHHYGFALTMPAFLMVVYVFIYILPNKLTKFSSSQKIMQFGSVIFILALVGSFVYHSSKNYRVKSFPVFYGSEKIYTEKLDENLDKRGEILNNTIDTMEKLLKEGENFLVLPQGVMLNYLLKRKSSTKYYTFLPSDYEMYGEDEILNDLTNASPDYILLVDMDTSFLGYKYFGKDYGVKTYSWIEENYQPYQLIGNWPFTDKGFGILICKKNQDKK